MGLLANRDQERVKATGAAEPRRGEHPILHQAWTDLAFLHYSASPEEIAPFIPRGLELDTFPEANGRHRAWIGVVPFRIAWTRPRMGPRLPWLGSFYELNVRTYVRRDGFEPAVLFLTLDAPNRLTNAVARWTFGVPYRHARVAMRRIEGVGMEVVCVRNACKPARTRVLCAPEGPPSLSAPGSLEHFLTERYRYFSETGGQVWTGRISHPPYRLRALNVLDLECEHCDALGLPRGRWEHACFCEGVTTAFFKPQRLRV